MKIDQFAMLFRQVSNVKQAESLLSAYLNSFEINSFALTYYAGHIKTGKKLHYHCVSPPLKEWHTYYLEQGFADVDTTLEEAYQMTLPLFWDVHEQLDIAKSKREAQIRMESIEFGIHKGLSLPVHGPHNDFISLTLHQRKGEHCLEKYEILQYEWLGAAQIYYHYIKKLLFLEVTPTHFLTKREEQCLLLTKKGWRVEQIAKELKISPRTVHFHLQNVNKKLGAHNKYYAAFQYFDLSK